ncbi:HD domain-containing protein [Candidatus Halobonum tyrrellensis]|uniref:HD domain-containing protein n=1 Tax=Candidatus Halobonum tyrrellensis G22 TaxID=1324957 RepID=V4J1P1_9EURY|nr:HD domain-containing protein [Candidatus Halobonum tyrrellensis]ESP89327.1 HD domain-containing protein [Candidatus Halobonum tyrrellensis G22]
MGVEIKGSRVPDEEFDEMKRFVRGYLAASVESEDDGGRMRWYPWHSAEYRFNHILNVVDIAERIADREGGDADVVRVAAVFHDVSKLEAEQDAHAAEGARVAREFLSSQGDYPDSFVEAVCSAIEAHSYQGPLGDLPLETRCLIEADLLDKIGANGTALMLLRMGYEARTHMDAARMVQRVYERGKDHAARVESDTAESIAHERLKRVRWFREWLEGEVTAMEHDADEFGANHGNHG